MDKILKSILAESCFDLKTKKYHVFYLRGRFFILKFSLKFNISKFQPTESL